MQFFAAIMLLAQTFSSAALTLASAPSASGQTGIVAQDSSPEATVEPTQTLTPTATTAPPVPTQMPPTNTSVPPTATNIPPTNTAVPPTATNVPPTNTALPPTATNVPPTNTSIPPTATYTMAPTATDTPVPSSGDFTVVGDKTTVDPGETVTFTVHVQGKLETAGTMALSIYFPITARTGGDLSALAGCAQAKNAYQSLVSRWQLWLNCPTAPDGSFDYSFSISGPALTTVGSTSVYGGIYEGSTNGPQLAWHSPAAPLTVVGPTNTVTVAPSPTLSPTATNAPPTATQVPPTNTATATSTPSITPTATKTPTATPTGTPTTASVGSSVTITTDTPTIDINGSASYTVHFWGAIPSHGTVDLDAYFPIVAHTGGEFGAVAGCSKPYDQDLGGSGGGNWNIELNCPTAPNGSFDFTYTVIGTISSFGTFFSHATLYTPGYGQTVLANLPSAAAVNVVDPTLDVTITTDTPSVDVGSSIRYTVHFAGTLSSQGNVEMDAYFPITNRTDADFSAMSACGDPSYDTVIDDDWNVEFICPSDSDGSFDYTYTITGTAPGTVGTVDSHATLYLPDSSVDLPSVAPVTVNGVDATGNISISLDPSTADAQAGGTITNTIHISGSIPAPGVVELDAVLPILNYTDDNVGTIPACSIDIEGSAGDGLYDVRILCSTGPDGSFDYTFTVSGDTPAQPGSYDASATLSTPTYGDFVIATADPAATLTVTGVADVSNITMTTDQPYYHVGDAATFSVTMNGKLAVPGSYRVNLTIPLSALTAENLDPDSSSCVKYDGYSSGPWYVYQLSCQTDAEGNFDYSFSLNGTIATTASVYGSNYSLIREDGLTLQSGTVDILVLAPGDSADNITFNIGSTPGDPQPGGTSIVSNVSVYGSMFDPDGTNIPLRLVIQIPIA
ncbi:MAG TPA: hypothetical protein VFQ54_08760, partial [Thermomicrobiales bacterium]|nr:hypothetical protein [Thermomicrobiales bacterium]